MSHSISTLLTRNLYEVFGENDAVRRRAPIHTAPLGPSNLEQALSRLLAKVRPGRGLRLGIFVQGKSRALNAVIQEQLILIGREAIMNALRHSAKNIEVEIQYLRNLLRLCVRDNGCGIDPEQVQKARDSRWGLYGMRDRTDNIGARFGIWRRTGAGTEVRVAVPVEVAITPA